MRKSLIILYFLLPPLILVGQENIKRCSTDEMVSKELTLNPDKKIILDQLETFTQNFISTLDQGRILDTTYIIPVVVHIIHDYGNERINMNQVESAIKAMCEDFSQTNDDLVDENGNFVPSVSNLGSDTVDR